MTNLLNNILRLKQKKRASQIPGADVCYACGSATSTKTYKFRDILICHTCFSMNKYLRTKGSKNVNRSCLGCYKCQRILTQNFFVTKKWKFSLYCKDCRREHKITKHTPHPKFNEGFFDELYNKYKIVRFRLKEHYIEEREPDSDSDSEDNSILEQIDDDHIKIISRQETTHSTHTLESVYLQLEKQINIKKKIKFVKSDNTNVDLWFNQIKKLSTYGRKMEFLTKLTVFISFQMLIKMKVSNVKLQKFYEENVYQLFGVNWSLLKVKQVSNTIELFINKLSFTIDDIEILTISNLKRLATTVYELKIKTPRTIGRCIAKLFFDCLNQTDIRLNLIIIIPKLSDECGTKIAVSYFSFKRRLLM